MSKRNTRLDFENFQSTFTDSFTHHVYHGKNGQKYLFKNVKYNNNNKGIIFVWPQRKKCPPNREFAVLLWFVAQCLYCLHIMNFWPNGSTGTGNI